VARKLLGKFFIRKLNKLYLIGRIVETEAYCEGDPASHSYHGKTERNEVMFWKGGHLYVYFTYGMHFCANVVTRENGIGEAVLIRAIEPIEGIQTMITNRSRRKNSLVERWKNGILDDLTSGPARVCEAFGLTSKDNGIDLCGDKVWVAEISNSQRRTIANEMMIFSKKDFNKLQSQDWVNQKFSIMSSTRIGIRNGNEKKWRFYIKGNLWVSKS